MIRLAFGYAIDEVMNMNTQLNQKEAQLVKELKGQVLEADEFSFTLTKTDADGNALTGDEAYSETVSNAEDGTVTFTEITYTEEDLELTDEGYADAKRAGDREGLKVFFAWEETKDGDDYLIYGLTPEWLLAHPEIEGCTRKRQLELVHEAGGCVIQAHPFRQRDYIRRILLGPQFCESAPRTVPRSLSNRPRKTPRRPRATRRQLPSTLPSRPKRSSRATSPRAR